MDFKQWLEGNQQVDIKWIDPEEDWELAERVEVIGREVGIRFNSNKDVSFAAMVGDQVVGGVADAFYNDDQWGDESREARVYDFDTVVAPQWQGPQMIGFQLIDAALQHAKEGDADLVSTHVVNLRLIPLLKSKYGFEGSSNREDRSDVLHKWL